MCSNSFIWPESSFALFLHRAESEDEESLDEANDEEEGELSDDDVPLRKRKSKDDAKKGKGKKRKDESSDEDGEAEMSDDDPEFEELRKYDATTLMGDSADRKYLDSLSSFDRYLYILSMISST